MTHDISHTDEDGTNDGHRTGHFGIVSIPHKVRHGGFTKFDQGATAVVKSSSGVTIMLTSKRIPPFSLAQFTSCDLDPQDFRVFVAKGVIAPQAAYRDICDRFIHVNTPGATCADMTQLDFKNRRRPMFPFEK